MLEFIVLGQIPGTTLQITFVWFMLVVLIGLLVLDVKIHRAQKLAQPDKRLVRPGKL